MGRWHANVATLIFQKRKDVPATVSVVRMSKWSHNRTNITNITTVKLFSLSKVMQLKVRFSEWGTSTLCKIV